MDVADTSDGEYYDADDGNYTEAPGGEIDADMQSSSQHNMDNNNNNINMRRLDTSMRRSLHIDDVLRDDYDIEWDHIVNLIARSNVTVPEEQGDISNIRYDTVHRLIQKANLGRGLALNDLQLDRLATTLWNASTVETYDTQMNTEDEKDGDDSLGGRRFDMETFQSSPAVQNAIDTDIDTVRILYHLGCINVSSWSDDVGTRKSRHLNRNIRYSAARQHAVSMIVDAHTMVRDTSSSVSTSQNGEGMVDTNGMYDSDNENVEPGSPYSDTHIYGDDFKRINDRTRRLSSFRDKAFAYLAPYLKWGNNVKSEFVNRNESGIPTDNNQETEKKKENMMSRIRASARSLQFPVSVIFLTSILLAVQIGLAMIGLFNTRNIKGVPWTIQVAKAAGYPLNYNSTFILLPMCRALISRARDAINLIDDKSSSFYRSLSFFFFPIFDYALFFHLIFAMLILVFGAVHTVAHIVDYTIPGGLHETVGNSGSFNGTGFYTGTTITVVFLLIFTFSLSFFRTGGGWRQKMFRLVHFLLWPFEIILIFHGPHYWRWLIPCGTLYLSDLVLRFLDFRKSTEIVRCQLFPPDTLYIEMRRPRRFTFEYGAFMWIRVPRLGEENNWCGIPSLTSLSHEFHPFTIVSSPEDESVVSLAIKNCGDWTAALYVFLQVM